MKRMLGVGVLLGAFCSLYGSENVSRKKHLYLCDLMKQVEQGCRKGNVALVEGILQKNPGLNVNRSHCVPALIETLTGTGSVENKIALIRALRGKDIDAEQEYKGMRAIHWALMSGCDAAVIEELLRGSCNANSLTVYGLSPLTLAVLKKIVSKDTEISLEVFEALLKRRARFKFPKKSVNRERLFDLLGNSKIAQLLGKESTEKSLKSGESPATDEETFSFFSGPITFEKVTPTKLIDDEDNIEVLGAYLCHSDLLTRLHRETGKIDKAGN